MQAKCRIWAEEKLEPAAAPGAEYVVRQHKDKWVVIHQPPTVISIGLRQAEAEALAFDLNTQWLTEKSNG